MTRQAHPLRNTWRSLVSLARVIPLAGWRQASFVWVWVVTTGLLPVAVSVVMAVSVEAGVDVAKDGFDGPAGDRLVWAMATFAGLFALQSLITTFGHMLLSRMGRHLNWHLRERVMRASVAPTGVHHVEDTEMQQAFQSAKDSSASGASAGFALEQLPGVVTDRIRALGYLLALAWVSPPFAAAMAVLTVLNQSEMAKSTVRILGASRGRISLTFSNYHRDLAITPPAAKEVRVFQLGGWLRQRYDSGIERALADVTEAGGADATREFTPGLLVTLAANGVVTAFGIVALARMAGRGEVGVGEFALAVSAVMGLRPNINLADTIIPFGVGVMDRVDSAEAAAASIEQITGAGGAGGLPERVIRFEDVSFRYPGSTVDVLRHLDLELRAGERTAVVGSNGVGKTTLVKLLARMYEPTGGRITVDGVDLTSLDPDSWRGQLAVLFQEFLRFDLSLRDNVGYGAPNASLADDELVATVRRAGAGAVLDRLPDGLATPLSPRFTGGTDLSGGEWQRVALARALTAVAAGARVLVLDEPTANLDVRAEAELYDQFLELTAPARTGGIALTTMLISHRFSTVRQADRIIVLTNGAVAEDGTHDSLLAADGLYAEMFRSQARRFADDEPPDAEVISP